VFPSLLYSMIIFLPLNAYDLSAFDPEDRYVSIRLRKIPKPGRWRSPSGANEECVDHPMTDNQDVTAHRGSL